MQWSDKRKARPVGYSALVIIVQMDNVFFFKFFNFSIPKWGSWVLGRDGGYLFVISDNGVSL